VSAHHACPSDHPTPWHSHWPCTSG